METSLRSTMTVSTVVVNVYAVVEDRKGRLVSNLEKEDFIVTEDNARQQTNYFGRETDAPLTLGIEVDTRPSQGSVLAEEQAKMLIRQVLRPQDSAFVLRFDRQVQLLQDLTGNQQLLAGAVDATAIVGGWRPALPRALPLTQAEATVGSSHLYDAVCLASKLMRNQVGRKVVVLLTDGEELGSAVKLNAALEIAQRADVIINSVGITDRAFYLNRRMALHGDSVLKKFSRSTGGRMSRVRDAGSTAAAFKQIGEELRGQYLLGYTPHKQRDGSFHTISGRVRDPNCRVRARRGYYAQPD
jgi:VWFA-related protein